MKALSQKDKVYTQEMNLSIQCQIIKCSIRCQMNRMVSRVHPMINFNLFTKIKETIPLHLHQKKDSNQNQTHSKHVKV